MKELFTKYKQKTILISILLLAFKLCGQTNSKLQAISVKGEVKDCVTHDPICNATIKLVGSDGSSIETKTDEQGLYFFDSTKIKHEKEYVISVISGEAKSKRSQRPYFNSNEKKKISTLGLDSSKIFYENFYLQLNVPGFLPLIIFDKNSFKINPIQHDSIDFIYQLMIDNSTFLVEIDGHADDSELKPEILSKKRADAVFQYLISKGIEKDRLVSASCSNTHPYIIHNYYYNTDDTLSKERISKIKERQEKENYNQLNRRVTIKIVGRDFIQSNK